MTSEKFLTRLVFLIFFIFFVNLLALKFYWYSSIWYIDMPMHFLGGMWTGLLLTWLLKPKEISLKSIFFIISGVFFVGVFWELFEIGLGLKITNIDTISDIFFDLSGGFFAVTYYWKKVMPYRQNNI